MSNCQGLGDCDESRLERLYEYLDGALPAVDVAEIRSHLESCAECREEHNLECMIRSAMKRSCSEQAPATLKTSILEKIHAIRATAETAEV
ncbi:mycothiol system anti-sigma-R factor [Sinomonas sp. ASV322]|uniref:mycothiol system anti-sigma-R factor n=1 Tax=Sinomonas sp. ASV322 TaxID=3041920 RepID=UPI0027DBDB6C|nr:mycothiol system anti-sigma-R factor [Sinomonas sp. ASV322]MDQ4502012.1 mycothiol system anti-sigma-R factor [Sinomonas sp. ASV322]